MASGKHACPKSSPFAGNNYLRSSVDLSACPTRAKARPRETRAVRRRRGRTRVFARPTAPPEGSPNSSAGRPGAGAFALSGHKSAEGRSAGAQIREFTSRGCSKEPSATCWTAIAPGQPAPRPNARFILAYRTPGWVGAGQEQEGEPDRARSDPGSKETVRKSAQNSLVFRSFLPEFDIRAPDRVHADSARALRRRCWRRNFGKLPKCH